MEMLREIMKSKGVSAKALSEATGIAQASISNIINGNASPKVRTLETIAAALDVKLRDLFAGQDGEPIYIKRGEQYLKIGEINQDISTL